MTKEQIDYFLRRRGINKKTLAKAMNIQQAAISYWLSGKRKMSKDHAKELQRLFNAPDDLPIDKFTLPYLFVIDNIFEVDNAYIKHMTKTLLARLDSDQ